jgi:methylglyoxal synthase
MANLGNFAGGFAQGMQAGHRMKLEREQFDSVNKAREVQAGIAKETHGWARSDRKSATAMQEQMAELQSRFYNDEVRPGTDAAVDMQFAVEMSALSIKNGKMNPKEWLGFQKELSAMRESEQGKQVMKAIASGQNSPEFQQVAAQNGLNTESLKWDPVKMSLSDGKKTIDMRFPIMAMGGMKFIEDMQKIRGHDRDEEMHVSNLGKNKAQTFSANASGTASMANANLTGVRAKNLSSGTAVDSKVGAAISTAVDRYVRNMKDPLTGQVDETAGPAVNRIALSLAASGKVKQPEAAAVTAAEEYRKILAEARTRAAAQPKEVMAKHGGPEGLARALAASVISRSFPMVAADTE